MPTPAAATPAHPLAPWLRARVLALRASTRRRVFPGSVELVPAGGAAGEAPVASWRYDEEPLDHALRVDVLVRLLTDCACRGVWRVGLVHVRPGSHEPTDLDFGWAAAGATAASISGVDVHSVLVVSRWGWLDLRSGATRRWVRPRDRRAG